MKKFCFGQYGGSRVESLELRAESRISPLGASEGPRRSITPEFDGTMWRFHNTRFKGRGLTPLKRPSVQNQHLGGFNFSHPAAVLHVQVLVAVHFTVFCDLEVSRAVEWAGKQDRRRLCKDATIEELSWRRSVFGCRDLGEVLEKYGAAHPAAH